jgi:hypothetical protein
MEHIRSFFPDAAEKELEKII